MVTSSSFHFSADPSDVHKYYCQGNTGTYTGYCDRGYSYDDSRKDCVANWGYNFNLFQQEVGVSNTPLCVKEGTFSLPQKDGVCRHFYTCKQNYYDKKVWDQTIYECAGYRRFNPSTKSCSYLSQCSYDAECFDYDIQCPGNGVFRHPYDCATYYYCTFEPAKGCFVARRYSCYGDNIYDVCSNACKPVNDYNDCKYLPLDFQKVS